MNQITDPDFFATLKATRQNVVNILSSCSEKQLVTIPTGFGNNILWNAGHMLTSQQLLCYAFSDLPLHIPEGYVPIFRTGTSPKNLRAPVDIAELTGLMISTVWLLESDYTRGLFKTYKPYPSSFGVTVNKIEDAILYNHVHEGIHLGTLFAMQRVL